MSPPLPPDEPERLTRLRRLGLLDTPPEPRFDTITRTAARLFEVPIVLLTLVDEDRQWFKSRVGLEISETTREVSFCTHAILEDAPFVVPDARQDPRFRRNPLVTGPPKIRFYAGRPLLCADGSGVGTLCLIDHEPRAKTDVDLEALDDLANLANDQLQAHRMLTLCSFCQRVRADGIGWCTAPQYLEARLAQRFSHGICPDCYGEHVQPHVDHLD